MYNNRIMLKNKRSTNINISALKLEVKIGEKDRKIQKNRQQPHDNNPQRPR
jgi:hypothetical protein